MMIMMNRLIHLFIYAADIQSGHHDATQSTSLADSADWSRGGAAVVSGSGAEKIFMRASTF
jgi:hypothetical protein